MPPIFMNDINITSLLLPFNKLYMQWLLFALNIVINSVALYRTFLNMKYISLCYNSFGFEYFAQYCSKFDLYSKKNICHINENIIGILIMSMNVCLIIRCKNKHIQKVTEITLLKILTFVSFCRIVTGWAWRF